MHHNYHTKKYHSSRARHAAGQNLANTKRPARKIIIGKPIEKKKDYGIKAFFNKLFKRKKDADKHKT
jgi:hypothetical protein